MGTRNGVRIAIALLVLVAATGAVTAKMNEITEAGYVDVKDSPCWSCHVSWAPPLREMAALTPPTGVTADVGGEFDYTVRVQNGWIAENIRLEPSIDISQAPSLTFADAPQPELANLTEGIIEPDDVPTGTQRGHVVVSVDAGTSDLSITLRPDNTDPVFGPDLTMRIYPGKDSTNGLPETTVDENGPGQEEAFTLKGAAAIQEYGYGPWTIEAQTTPVTAQPNPNAATGVPFKVITDKYYNATGGIQFKSLDLGIDNGLEEGQGSVFTWRLRVVDTPQEGEVLTARLNLTSYYRHADQSYEDVAYTHHRFDAPVVADGGGVGFETDTSTIAVGGPDVGVSLARISEVIGYISGFLVLASIYTGGMFGKKSRRQLNKVFYSAKRRVAFHNFLSYGILAAALVHTFIFLWHWPNIEGNYHWSQGLIWGGVAILAMIGLGLTGALQVPMIRKWNYGVWRWSHFGLTIAVIVFTVVHILLDGGNFGEVQDQVGWTNPLDPRR